MKILFLGDLVGRSGRDVAVENLPRLRRELALDFVVVNGENAAHGFGLTDKICMELFEVGTDVITSGNHIWDKADIMAYIEKEPRLLRPQNYPARTPGRGSALYRTADGRVVKVVNVMCRLFMELLDDPFAVLEQELPPGPPKRHGLDAVIVDVHGEATSEKMAIGHVADGRASLVVGTHTHVPTADAHVMKGGTAYHTDAGMCGDYDSVIGMQKEGAVGRFLGRLPRERMQPAAGEATLCGTYLETDDATGLAARVASIRLGGMLQPQWPV